MAPKRSRMLSAGTFCLSLLQGVKFQASKPACRHVCCMEKHTGICDRTGVAVEREKRLGESRALCWADPSDAPGGSFPALRVWTLLPQPSTET